MIQDVAKELLKVVNDKKTMDALEKYMNYRVEELHKLLEQQDKISDINKAQGAIKELRRIKTLREDVISKARG